MSSIPNILIFDSGGGGLSIAVEVHRLTPSANLIYSADNEQFPYGLIKESALTQRVVALMGNLLQRHSPDIVVIACNTASTIALDALREKYSQQPFVGVVPAIKPAAQQSATSVIGLLATPATVERKYTDNLIKDFAQNCEVLRLGSHKLVEYAEKEIIGAPVSDTLLLNELDKLRLKAENRELDTVVLACTHFPILKHRFEKLKGWEKVQWIDSGEAIARRVSHLLQTTDIYLNKRTDKQNSIANPTATINLALPDSRIERAYLSYLAQRTTLKT